MAGPYYLSQAGGGGVEINGIGRFNKKGDITQFTDGGGNIWLRTGNLLTSGFSTYPDADAYSDASRNTLEQKRLAVNFGTYENRVDGKIYIRNNGIDVYYYGDRNNFARGRMTTPWNINSFSVHSTSGTYITATRAIHLLEITNDGNYVIYGYGTNIFKQQLNGAWNVSGMTSTRTQILNINLLGPAFMSYNGKYMGYLSSSGSTITGRMYYNSTAYGTTGWTPVGTGSTTLLGAPDILTKNSASIYINNAYINSTGTLLRARLYNNQGVYGYMDVVFNTPYNFETATIVAFGTSVNRNTSSRAAFDRTLAYEFIIPGGENSDIYRYGFPTAIGIKNIESPNDFLRIK